MRYNNSMSMGNTGVTHYHALLGLPDKGRSIKGVVICYAVWLGSMKGSYDMRKVRESVPLLWSG